MAKVQISVEEEQTKSHQPESKRPVMRQSAGPEGDNFELTSLQQMVGNRAVQRLLAPRTGAGLAPPSTGTAQRSGEGSFELDDDTASRISRERSGGQPLESALQERVSTTMAHDLSSVRVHTSKESDDLNRQLGAKAFTTGQDIFFREGAYDPHSSGGRELIAHELTHVVQQSMGAVHGSSKMTVTPSGDAFEQEADHVAQAVATGLPVHLESGPSDAVIQRRDGEGGPRVRFPTLEIFAATAGGALATRGTPLTSRETTTASSVFGNSINLSAVRIVETRIANAPTTLGNYIRVPPGYSMPDRILIHELAHVWQFQTRGTRYISDSVWHQTTAWLTRGGRGAAYDYTIVTGQSIDRYPAEHQACIIEDYFAYPHLRTDPEYQRLIAEVRAARPIALSVRLEEAAGILGRPEIPSPTGELPGAEGGGIVPQIRIEF